MAVLGLCYYMWLFSSCRVGATLLCSARLLIAVASLVEHRP